MESAEKEEFFKSRIPNGIKSNIYLKDDVIQRFNSLPRLSLSKERNEAFIEFNERNDQQ